MKKRNIVICLSVIGAVFLIASFVIPLVSVYAQVNTTDIIGGAGAPTFELFFRQTYRGVYPLMTFLGAGMLTAALIVGLAKNTSVTDSRSSSFKESKTS